MPNYNTTTKWICQALLEKFYKILLAEGYSALF